MKNLILILLLLAVLVFGAKTYMETRYSRLLTQQTLLHSSKVAISHESVKIDWDGSLLINNLRVQPIETDLTMFVGQLRVSSPMSFKTMLDIRTLEGGELDHEFDVSVNGISIDGARLSSSDRNADCRSLSSMYVFSELDMLPLRVTTNFRLDLRDSDSVELHYDSLDMLGNYRGRVVVEKNNLRDALSSRGPLIVSKLSVRAQLAKDKADQLLQHCANVFALAKEDYVDRVLDSPEFSINSFNVDFGPAARSSIVAYLRGDSELLARFRGFGSLRNLVTDSSENSIWRKLEIELDDTPIAIELPEVEEPELTIDLAEIEELNERSSGKKAYIESDIEDAINYVGRWVRIDRTRGRKPVIGKLLNETLDGLLVKVLHKKGDVILTVMIEDTERFSVREK